MSDGCARVAQVDPAPRTSAAWDWLGVKQRSTNSAHGHSLSRTRYHRYASQRLPRLKAEATVLTNETYRLLSPMSRTSIRVVRVYAGILLDDLD